MIRNRLSTGALLGTAVVMLAVGGGGPAFGASSTGASHYRYSQCGPDASDPTAQVCESGHGTANLVQAPNGTFVLSTHDSNVYTVTSPDAGTYTATTNGSFTNVVPADQVHGVLRFHDRQVFSQTGYPTCIAVDNFVYANGQVRHESSTYDCGG
jgi:hypothetical protein